MQLHKTIYSFVFYITDFVYYTILFIDFVVFYITRSLVAIA